MRIVRYYPRAVTGDGGMSGAIRRWSESTAALGADMTIAYDAGVERESDSKRLRWIPIRNAGRDRTRFPLTLRDVLKDADLLVLHSGWTLHNVRAAQVARALGVPYLLEPRGAYDPRIVARNRAAKKMWWGVFERKLVQNARGVHVFFEEQRAHIAALGYRGKYVEASNGIDAPVGPAWDGGSGGYILWLGRFDPEHKGLDLLVDAVATLDPGARPRILLHGPDWHRRKADVEAQIGRRDIGDRVMVRDAIYGAEKRSLLIRAQGFVYPSRWEACGNSVLEAVSLGVPTLTTGYPLGRWLAARGGAYSVDPTVDGLRDGLQRLSSGSDAALVGKKGAEAVRDDLSWDAVARRWLSQVEDLV